MWFSHVTICILTSQDANSISVVENKTDEGKSDCKHHNTSGSEGQPLNRECSDNNDKDTSNYQINLKQTGPTPLTPKRNKVFGYFVQLFRPGKKSVTHHEEVIELQNQYSCLDIFRSRTMFLNTFIMCSLWYVLRALGYKRVYLPFYKVADTPFYNQGDDLLVHWRFRCGVDLERTHAFHSFTDSGILNVIWRGLLSKTNRVRLGKSQAQL